jgi:hypothetical protein
MDSEWAWTACALTLSVLMYFGAMDRGACRPNVAVGPGRFSGARVGNLRRMLAFGNIGLEGQNACSVTRS